MAGNENGVQALSFIPPVTGSFRCLNVSFANDDVVEDQHGFSVIFEPANPNDRFPNGNRINFTIVDDESEWISALKYILEEVLSRLYRNFNNLMLQLICDYPNQLI